METLEVTTATDAMRGPFSQALPAESALLRLGAWLQAQNYQFVTPTPATHARVRQQPRTDRHPLRDAFGWSRPFDPQHLPHDLLEAAVATDLIVRTGAQCQSRVRFSSLADLLLSHSAYPTADEDAVFFGPDTYRFARFIEQVLRNAPWPAGGRIVDIGCGGGAGGLVAARCAPGPIGELVLADINPQALVHARANARRAGQPATVVHSDLYANVGGEFALIVSNPPYLVDDRQRAYRHGGGPLGGELSQRIVEQGLDRLAPGGRMVLYTGAAIADGRDAMRDAIETLAADRRWPWRYEEIDPDVFGEELATPAYAHCDRIAAVGAVIQRPA